MAEDQNQQAQDEQLEIDPSALPIEDKAKILVQTVFDFANNYNEVIGLSTHIVKAAVINLANTPVEKKALEADKFEAVVDSIIKNIEETKQEQLEKLKK
jgi:hypothetical protein